MSTQANPSTEAKVEVSAKIKAAILAVVKAETAREIALDNYRNVAKSEAVRLGLSDKKALTAILFASGDTDARRVSEVVGFVFPASDSARKELDKVAEHNAKQTDIKKRIPKEVVLALQRDKTGKLTVEKAKANLAANKRADGSERQPGGKTKQTATPDEKKTAAEIEEELGNLFAAALNFGKKHGYDIDDCTAVFEVQAEAVFPAEDKDDDDEGDKD